MVNNARLIAFFGISLPLLAACGPGAPQGVGGLVARPALIDLGTIGSLAPVETSVELFNTGSKPIRIEAMEGECSCTVPELTERVIAPGASIVVPIRYNAVGKEGPQRENVQVTWESYALFIGVQAVVEDSLDVEPRNLEFDGLVGADIPVQRIEIYARGDAPFRVLGVSAPDYLRVEAPPPDLEGLSATIAFTASAGLELGNHADTIVIETSDPHQPIIHVPSTVIIRSVLTARPRTLVLRAPAAGSAPEPLAFQVFRNDGRAFRIKSVTSLDGGPPLTFEFEADSREIHDVTLLPGADLRAAPPQGRIEIAGEAGPAEVVTLPVVNLASRKGGERQFN